MYCCWCRCWPTYSVYIKAQVRGQRGYFTFYNLLDESSFEQDTVSISCKSKCGLQKSHRSPNFPFFIVLLLSRHLLFKHCKHFFMSRWRGFFQIGIKINTWNESYLSNIKLSLINYGVVLNVHHDAWPQKFNSVFWFLPKREWVWNRRQ